MMFTGRGDWVAFLLCFVLAVALIVFCVVAALFILVAVFQLYLRQLLQIRETVQHSREPVAIADAQGRLLHANDAFADLVAPGRGGPLRWHRGR